MINLGLCLLLLVPAAFADLSAQRDFYQRLHMHVRASVPSFSQDHLERIKNLAEGDVAAYFEVMFESWLDVLPDRQRNELRSISRRIDFVPAERFPEYSLRAELDAWNQVHILLPTHLERSILYYYLLIHELDHARQRLAVLDGTDLEFEDLWRGGKFWAKFEIEKSAMTMEWFFLHHLPGWARSRLAREIGSLLQRDNWSAMAQLSAESAPLPLEEYLQAQWSADRYSWSILNAAACADLLN